MGRGWVGGCDIVGCTTYTLLVGSGSPILFMTWEHGGLSLIENKLLYPLYTQIQKSLIAQVGL